MGSDYIQETVEQQATRRTGHGSTQYFGFGSSEQTSAIPPGGAALSSRVGLHGRGAEPARQAAVQRMQQTYGNFSTRQAVARLSSTSSAMVQRATQSSSRHSPLPVQREEDDGLWWDDEEKSGKSAGGMAAAAGLSLEGMSIGGGISPLATGPLFALQGKTFDADKDPSIQGIKDAMGWVGDKLAGLGEAGEDAWDTAMDKVKHPIRSAKELYNWIF